MSDNDSIAKVCANMRLVFSDNPGYLDILDDNPDGPLRKLITSIINSTRTNDIDIVDCQDRALISILHIVNSACATDYSEKDSDSSIYLTAFARTLRNMFNQIDSGSRYDKTYVVSTANRSLSMAMAACMLIIEIIPLNESQKRSIETVKEIFRMLDGPLNIAIRTDQDMHNTKALEFLRAHYYDITSNAQFTGHTVLSTKPS